MVVRLYALDQLLDLGVTDRIVYIDCDTIIQKDISEMFTVNLNGNWIAAAPEMFDMDNPTARDLYKNTVRLYDHRMNLNPRYFNSGVMVIDLEKVGKNRFVPEFKNTSALSVFPDQDILNFLGNPYAVMPLSFNAMADFHLWRFREVAQSINHRRNMENAFIIHFAGVTKPWEIRGELSWIPSFAVNQPTRHTLFTVIWKCVVREHLFSEFSKILSVPPFFPS